MAFINLRNQRYFPLAATIPHHADTTTDLFIPSPNTVKTDEYKPKVVPEPPVRRLRHWCTVAGLNYGNMMLGVHDIIINEMDFGLCEAGREMELIQLRSNGLLNDPDGGRTKMKAVMPLATTGSVAVMYTVDLVGKGDQGLEEYPSTMLHIPDAASIRTFNCKIDRVFEINDAFHARVKADKLGHCQRCNRPAANRCERCKTSYCGADCQKRDWVKHRTECEVITQIRDWSTFDWDVYEEPYVFKKVDKASKPASSS